MAGIEKSSGGEIIIKGKRIHKMSENSLAKFRQRFLGFVFQSYNLMNSMTALENVEFPLIFKRVKIKKRKALAKDMLNKVGLGTRLNHKPNEMSGGQQQRVGIARAFVSKPEIVFADEPTGNLDTKTAMEVMNLIKNIAKENNQTIVMVTHDRRIADFADKIIHILDGKIQSIEIINRECTEIESTSNNSVTPVNTQENNDGIDSSGIDNMLPDVDGDNFSVIEDMTTASEEIKGNIEERGNKE
jgi:putative ABC transport system ATP-binding protein